MAENEEKSPIDQALELFVYAPLGLALIARDQLPALIERGRQQVSSQMALAKMMGKYAVREGEKEVKQRVEKITETLAANPPPRPPATTTPRAPTSTSADEGHATNGKAPTPAAPKRSGAHLAIPGYDTLSASQVVQRLAGLAPDELEAVREYEAATRGRRTILSKVTQLQAEAEQPG
jgi:hypothetical protein